MKRKVKNLLNPTPAQIKYRNRLWANALRENKKKAKRQMRDGEGGRCCLAVASDVAHSHGVKGLENVNFPHENVGRFFGWGFKNPTLKTKKSTYSASVLNDGNTDIELSHQEIAECVENTFVHPKNPKWNLCKE